MENKTLLVSLVAIFALVLTFANVSATDDFVSKPSVEVNSLSGNVVSAFAGETLPVRVTFSGLSNASDVRIKVEISGARDVSYSSERFNVVEGGVYSRLIAVTIPSNIDSTENLQLLVSVESRNSGHVDADPFTLAAQRESYTVEVLDVNMQSKVQAGSNLALDVVLKNRGMELAEDTFVKVKIPALGIEQRSYFGDMSAVDEANPDKEDASERRMLLNIPSDAKPGVYVVEIEAYNGDSSTVITKKVVISGASENSMIVSAVKSKTFAVGDTGIYTLTLVNSGNKIAIYELVIESSDDSLNVNVNEPIVVVPAGTSKTVTIEAQASKAGKYNFVANVYSSGNLVSEESFVANVQGSSTSKVFSGNTAVVLTVVLAIIFVVLLVVLIVLLTRKPEKSQETGESYY